MQLTSSAILYCVILSYQAQFLARQPQRPRSLTYAVQETYNFLNCILFCPGGFFLKKTNSGKLMYRPHTTCHRMQLNCSRLEWPQKREKVELNAVYNRKVKGGEQLYLPHNKIHYHNYKTIVTQNPCQKHQQPSNIFWGQQTLLQCVTDAIYTACNSLVCFFILIVFYANCSAKQNATKDPTADTASQHLQTLAKQEQAPNKNPAKKH